MIRSLRVLPMLALAAVVASTSACFVVAAGAGAGAAIAYTNRGASASVPGTIDAVFDRSVSAFGALSVNETGRATENSGALRRLEGKQGDREIIVELKRNTDDVTAVEVIAKKSVVEYDKELAKKVLDRIVAN
ncbi:MAG: DUF3568 family protein [Gemmatimonadaceae bacterium]|nr:DUF3568 family protein [Gemmatimonadaceae bacterium]